MKMLFSLAQLQINEQTMNALSLMNQEKELNICTFNNQKCVCSKGITEYLVSKGEGLPLASTQIIQHLNCYSNQLKKQNKKLQKEASFHRIQHQKLKEQKDFYQDRIKQLKEQNCKQSQQSFAINKRVNQMLNKYNMLKESYNRLMMRQQNMINQLKQIRNEKKQMSTVPRKQEENLHQFEQGNKKLKSIVNNLEIEYSSLKNFLQIQKSSNKEKINQLHNKLYEQQRRIQFLERELGNQRKVNQKFIQQKTNQLNFRVQKIRISLKETIQLKDNQIGELKVKIKESQQKYNILLCQKEKQMLFMKNEKNSKMVSLIKKLEIQLENQRVKSQKQKMNLIEKYKNEFGQQLKQYKQQVVSLQAQLSKLTSQNQSLKSRIQIVQNLFENKRKQQFQKYIKQIKILHIEYKNKINYIDKNHQEELRNLRIMSSQQERSIKDTYQNKLKRLENQIANKLQENNLLKENFKILQFSKKNLDFQMQVLREKVTFLNSLNSQYSKENQILDAFKYKIENQLKKYKHQMNINLKEKTQKLYELQQLLKSKQSYFAEIENQLKMINQSKVLLTEEKNAVEKRMKQAEYNNWQMFEQIRDLNQKLNYKEDQLNKTKKELVQQVAASYQNKQIIEKQKIEITILKRNLNEVKNILDNQKSNTNRFNQDIEKLNQKLKQSYNQNENYDREISRLKSIQQNYQNELTKFRLNFNLLDQINTKLKGKLNKLTLENNELVELFTQQGEKNKQLNAVLKKYQNILNQKKKKIQGFKKTIKKVKQTQDQFCKNLQDKQQKFNNVNDKFKEKLEKNRQIIYTSMQNQVFIYYDTQERTVKKKIYKQQVQEVKFLD